MYEATFKQKKYFTALTGEYLPFKCSKSQASRLIEKALKGEHKKKEVRIEVKGFAIDTWYNNFNGEVKYGWAIDYLPEVTSFATFEEALEACQRRYPDANIIESRGVVNRSCPD